MLWLGKPPAPVRCTAVYQRCNWHQVRKCARHSQLPQAAITGFPFMPKGYRIIFTDAAGGESNAADVSVRSQDMVKTAPNFGYYQVISTVVPENVTTVTVYLEATGGTDDSVILDDVSLTVV